MNIALGLALVLVPSVVLMAIIWGVCAVSGRASREEERRKGGRL